jgi:hypothetical protein
MEKTPVVQVDIDSATISRFLNALYSGVPIPPAKPRSWTTIEVLTLAGVCRAMLHAFYTQQLKSGKIPGCPAFTAEEVTDAHRQTENYMHRIVDKAVELVFFQAIPTTAGLADTEVPHQLRYDENGLAKVVFSIADGEVVFLHAGSTPTPPPLPEKWRRHLHIPPGERGEPPLGRFVTALSTGHPVRPKDLGTWDDDEFTLLAAACRRGAYVRYSDSVGMMPHSVHDTLEEARTAAQALLASLDTDRDGWRRRDLETWCDACDSVVIIHFNNEGLRRYEEVLERMERKR